MSSSRRTRTTFQRFIESEASGGVLLMGSTALALAVANTFLGGAYEEALHARVAGLDLRDWINDGLMTFFFLLVGLEIKREMVEGQLDTWPRRVLPLVAAFGGMFVPAVIFMAVNFPHPENWRGWAVPTATDIAFALGVLALVGSRVPGSLKVFLTSLAIIDDLGAILIIAIFYASNLSFAALAVAAVFAAALYWLNQRGETRLLPYILLGVLLWTAMLFSGIHATLAGVVLAMMIPIDNAERRPALAAAQHGARAVSLGGLSGAAHLRLRQCRRGHQMEFVASVAARARHRRRSLPRQADRNSFCGLLRQESAHRGASRRRQLAPDLRRRGPLRHRFHHEFFHRLARFY